MCDRLVFADFAALYGAEKLPQGNLLILGNQYLTAPGNLMVKPFLRTRSIGTKVTEDEYEEFEHTEPAARPWASGSAKSFWPG